MLTPENLDMIKRLQPLFNEKMGEWQIGDEYYNGYKSKFVNEVDLYWFNTLTIYTGEFEPPIRLRIPKPIDWLNPERGLWGMVDWDSIEHKSTP